MKVVRRDGALTPRLWARAAVPIVATFMMEEEKTMDVVKTTELAHALYRAHGDKAEWEAAQKERAAIAEGNDEEAADWRAIRGDVRRLRGANQS